MTSVSVIVPVKNSERTIRGTVEALLAQDYAGPLEIVLVGDVGDSTWDPIRAEIDAGAVRIIETSVRTGGRDANHKRNLGLEAASADVLCLTDGDMAPAPDWVATGVDLLVGDGWSCVAGPMASAEPGFWGEYVDGNPFVSKTPRIPCDCVTRHDRIGRRGHKPAVTANVLFTREVYERVGGLDPTFVHSYEDYEWFQRIADAGYDVLCSPRLTARHHHRQGWLDLLREYHRSGRGCAQFVRKHRSSHLGRSRIQQLVLVLVLAALGVLDVLAAATGISGLALAALSGGCALAVCVSLACALRTRQLIAAAYPVVTLVLGVAFSAGMLAEFMPVPSARRAS